MTISELIAELQVYRARHGDIQVWYTGQSGYSSVETVSGRIPDVNDDPKQRMTVILD